MYELSIPRWAYQKDIHTERSDYDHEYDWFEEPQRERDRRRTIFLNTRRRNSRRNKTRRTKVGQ
jgi:hypothetical protein